MILTLAKKIAFQTPLKWITLGFLALLILSWHSKWTERKALKELKMNCSKHKEPIFVALLGEHSSKDTSLSLFSIFESSSCPYRVHVFLYELIDEEHGAVDLYHKFAIKNSKSGTSYQNQITVMQRQSSDGGPYQALMELFKYNLSTSYDYVFTMNDSVRLQRNWDVLCLERIKSLEKTALVISPYSYPSFTVLSGFENDLPLIGLRSMHTPSCTQSKFFMRTCSFSPREFWNLKLQNHPSLTYGTDAFISVEAANRGWKFFSPYDNIYSLDNTESDSLWNYITEKAQKSIFDEFKTGLKTLGLNPLNSDPFMGIVNNNNEKEIKIKYGSLADYIYLSNK